MPDATGTGSPAGPVPRPNVLAAQPTGGAASSPPRLLPGASAVALARLGLWLAVAGLAALALLLVPLLGAAQSPDVGPTVVAIVLVAVCVASGFYFDRRAGRRRKEEAAAGYSTLRQWKQGSKRGPVPENLWILDHKTGAIVRPPVSASSTRDA